MAGAPNREPRHRQGKLPEMGKTVLLCVSIALTVVLACGVALAATITCQGSASCFGTDHADTMTGTSADNNIFGEGGNYNDASADYVRGGSGADSIIGGFATGGVDHIYGGKGNDSVNAAQRTARGVPVTKEIVHCGPGPSDTEY